MDAKSGTPEGDELDILVILIEKYESENVNILPPDPVAAIKFRMEQLGMQQADFGRIVGSNRASEILNGQRKISRGLIKKIHDTINIPYESLFEEIRNTDSRHQKE